MPVLDLEGVLEVQVADRPPALGDGEARVTGAGSDRLDLCRGDLGGNGLDVGERQQDGTHVALLELERADEQALLAAVELAFAA